MNYLSRQALILLACVLFPLIGRAQDDTNSALDHVPGFLGHPLLAQNGYMAEPGSFLLTILGSGTPTDLENILDNDPENASAGFNLIDATVGYNELVRILPDPTSKVTPGPLPNGKNVGFVIAPSGDNLNILDLSLIHMFTINLLDIHGEIIESILCQTDEKLNILDLSLVSVTGETIQKTIATIPEHPTYSMGDNKGMEGVVYGISLSVAGVDANVARQIKIKYAFIDDYEIVPIIKKYYPNAEGERSYWPFTKDAPTLVNNDLTDGATMTILNAYSTFTVYSGESTPFPQGVEAGWVLTAGEVLKLDISSVITFQGVTVDGKIIDISQQFSLANVELAGGGTYVYSFMTPVGVDLIGFQLKVAGLTVELGATVVNYAYIKLPTAPPTDITPFTMLLEAVPGSQVSGIQDDDKANPYITNKYQNTLYFRNNPEKPLYIPGQTPEEDYKATWLSRTAYYQGYIHKNPSLTLAIQRRANLMKGNETDELIGYIDIVMTTDKRIGGESTGYEQNKVFYRKRATDTKYYNAGAIAGKTNTPVGKGGWEILDFDGNTGIIDLAGMKFDEDENAVKLYHKSQSTDDNNIIGYEYKLYYIMPGENAAEEDAEENGVIRLLDTSDISIPAITAEWELAGTVDYIRHDEISLKPVDGDELDVTLATEGPSTEVEAGTYNHYITIGIPDEIDYKTTVKQFNLYRYSIDTEERGSGRNKKDTDFLKRELVDSYTRNPENPNKWISSKGVLLDQVHISGLCKIVAFIEKKNSSSWYGVDADLELSPKYKNELITDYRVNESELTGRNMTYTWHWDDERDYHLPQITELQLYSAGSSTEYWIYSTWEVDLNPSDSKYIHVAQLNSTSEYADDPRNVEIIYNHWSILKNPATGETLSKKIRTLAGEGETEDASVTDFNLMLNTSNSFNTNADLVDASTDYGSDPSTNNLNLRIIYKKELVDNSTEYTGLTRAYIPVVPAGFESKGLSENIQTYLVIEEQTSDPLTISKVTTGVNEVVTSEGKAEYYTLQGIKVDNPQPGFYIVRRGKTFTKEYVRK